jgi:putative addiction module component (TIGR02574 family)
MSKPTISEVLSLSLPDRIRLAQALWDSISEFPENLPLTEADRVELARRLDAYYRDPACGSPWEDVKERIRQRARG